MVVDPPHSLTVTSHFVRQRGHSPLVEQLCQLRVGGRSCEPKRGSTVGPGLLALHRLHSDVERVLIGPAQDLGILELQTLVADLCPQRLELGERLSEPRAGFLVNPGEPGQPEQLAGVDRRCLGNVDGIEDSLRVLLTSRHQPRKHLDVLVGDPAGPACDIQRVHRHRRGSPQLALPPTLGQHRAVRSRRKHVQLCLRWELLPTDLHGDHLLRGEYHGLLGHRIDVPHEMAALHRQQHFVEEHRAGGGAVPEVNLHQPLRLAQKHPEVVLRPPGFQQPDLGLRDQIGLQQRLRVILRRRQRSLLVALVDTSGGMPHRGLGRQERVALVKRHPLEVEVVGKRLRVRLIRWMVEVHFDQRIVRDEPELSVKRGFQTVQRDTAEVRVRLNAIGVHPDVRFPRVVCRVRGRVLAVEPDALDEPAVQQPERVFLERRVRVLDLHRRSGAGSTQLTHGEARCGERARRRPQQRPLVCNTRNLNEAGAGPCSGNTDLRTR